MGHYECKDCGEYMCLGECKDPEVIERKATAAREKYLSDNKWVLEKEHLRRESLLEARKNLSELGEYDAEKYGYLFE